MNGKYQQASRALDQRACMIAVDWGTTSFRAAKVSADGTVLDILAAARGISTVQAGAFEGTFRLVLSNWERELDTLPIYLCGMAGSRQGWVEARYVDCPAEFGDIADAVVRLTAGGMNLRFIPGLHRFDATTGHDVMRGEETQVIGAQALGCERIVVTPGTHSKWILARDRSVADFRTFMTGDMFAALKGHTILKHSMDANESRSSSDTPSFEEGVRRGFRSTGIAADAFAVRARSLFDDGAFHAESYLSGLLIGNEYAAGRERYPDAWRHGLTLIGSHTLTACYERAAEYLGVDTQVADLNASIRGCFELAKFNGEIQ